MNPLSYQYAEHFQASPDQSDNSEESTEDDEEEEEDAQYDYEVSRAVDELTKELQDFESEVQRDADVDLNKTTNEFLVFIDSRDRQFVDNETTFNFNLSTNDMSEGASINDTKIKNILKIDLVEISIPNFYIDLKEALFLDFNNIITSNKSTTDSNNIRLQRLLDIKYINLDIDIFSNDLNVGTNNSFNNKMFVLKLNNTEEKTNKNSGFYMLNGNKLVEIGNINNSILAGTDKKILMFKPIGNTSFFLDEGNNNLRNMKISINRNNNEPLNYLNDILTVTKFKIPSGTPKISIEFAQMFSSDEYSLGDRIFFKKNSIQISGNNDYGSFITYLENENGHSIIGHFGDSDNTPIGTTNLFKGIYIPTKFTYNNDVGSASIFDNFDFGLSTDTNFTTEDGGLASNNKVINLQNQILITLKITTEKVTE